MLLKRAIIASQTNKFTARMYSFVVVFVLVVIVVQKVFVFANVMQDFFVRHCKMTPDSNIFAFVVSKTLSICLFIFGVYRSAEINENTKVSSVWMSGNSTGYLIALIFRAHRIACTERMNVSLSRAPEFGKFSRWGNLAVDIQAGDVIWSYKFFSCIEIDRIRYENQIPTGPW